MTRTTPTDSGRRGSIRLVVFLAGMTLMLAACGPSNYFHRHPTTALPTTALPTTGPPTTTPPTTTGPTITGPGTSTSSPTTTDSTTTSRPTTPKPPVDDDELTIGLDATAPSAGWRVPALGAVSTDPAYGTPIRRVSSADGTRFNRNTYSRRQAESADGSYFFTYHGEAQYRVYDTDSLDLVRVLPIHPDSEPQWNPDDDTKLRYIAGPNSSVGDLRWHEIDVVTGKSSVIADLTTRVQGEYPRALYLQDRAEGSPSADGDRVAWIVYDGNEDPIAIVSYDLATDKILGLAPVPADLANSDLGLLDWVSMSPTGDHVMAGYWYATYVYDADLTNERLVNDKAEHSDIALGSNGHDIYVAIDFSSGPNGGWLVATDLVTMEQTLLFDLYDNANTSIHISGKAYDTPGWAVVSTYNCKVPGAWSCQKVMAVQFEGAGHAVDGSTRVVNLAHTYNCGDGYWTETQAVTNRDLSRIYFNSDGGSCGTDAEVYTIDVPTLP